MSSQTTSLPSLLPFARIGERPQRGGLTTRKLAVIALGLLLLLAFGLRVGLALVWPNLFRPDEIFQTIEPAYRMVTGWGVVTWEWRAGIRSWMFPGFLAGLIQLSFWLGVGRDGYMLLITAVMSLCGAAMAGAAFAVGWRHAKWTGALTCGVLIACWPDLVYFGAKTLSEVQAGHLLMLAICLASTKHWPMSRQRVCLLIGVLLGLTFCLRIQLAPALLPVAIATGRRDLRGQWLPLILGGLVPVAAMGLIDLMTLGSPFQSVWKYFDVNLIEGRSLRYGIEGPFWYFRGLLQNWGVAVPFLVLLFALGGRKAPLAAITAATVLLTHSAVAHKEYSFIYAAIPPMLLVVGLGAAEVIARLNQRYTTPAAEGRLTVLALCTLVLMAGAAAVGGGYRHGLIAGSANLIGMAAVHNLPDICGLGVYNAGFPSYAITDRRVPAYLAQTQGELEKIRPAANYFLVAQKRITDLPWATVRQCQGGLCVLHSETACTPVPSFEVNAVFIREGY